MPDRAGVKTRWLDAVKLILKVIPSLPRLLIASRPSVVDARVHEAGDPSPAVGTLVLSMNFSSITVHQEDQI
jgi:hypothetical protein